MPLSTKAIKQKIKSTGNIKKITKTMEMVSVSKMKKSVAKATGSRAYSSYALELLVNLSGDIDAKHPLMTPGKENKELLVVITSSKGLCGGYHTNIFKILSQYVTSAGKNIKVIAIGKYADKFAGKLDIEKFASFNGFSEKSDLSEIRNMSHILINEYIEGGYNSAKILYTEFINSTSYKPVLRELFPISASSVGNILEAEGKEIKKGVFSNYILEPSAEEILESVLPGLVDAVIYQTVLESFASEHSARMIAMKNAGDNASEMLDDLVLSYNQARQAGITQELSEIVAGAEALA